MAVHTFAIHVFMSFSAGETLPPKKVNLSTSFKSPLFTLEMSPLKIQNLGFSEKYSFC